jgi:hypothetical protein
MPRRKQVHPQRRVVVDSEEVPVEVEAVRSAELAGSLNLRAMPCSRAPVPESTAEGQAPATVAEAAPTVTDAATVSATAENSAEGTAIIGRIATAITGTVSVTEAAPADADSTAELAGSTNLRAVPCSRTLVSESTAEGPVGQTGREQEAEGAGPTGPASADPSAEPSLLQRVYNWLMT